MPPFLLHEEMAEIEVICAGLAMTTERLEGMLKDLKYKIYKETKEKDIEKWLKIHKNTETTPKHFGNLELVDNLV